MQQTVEEMQAEFFKGRKHLKAVLWTKGTLHSGQCVIQYSCGQAWKPLHIFKGLFRQGKVTKKRRKSKKVWGFLAMLQLFLSFIGTCPFFYGNPPQCTFQIASLN